LQALPQPLKGCYEAGPTGFALYRPAEPKMAPVAAPAVWAPFLVGPPPLWLGCQFVNPISRGSNAE